MSVAGSLRATTEPSWQEVALDVLRDRARRERDPALAPLHPSFGEDWVDELRSRKLDSLLYAARGEAPPIQRVYDRVWRAQRGAALELIAALGDAGITPIVFKGAELIARWNRDQPIGLHCDVDLLVGRYELGPVKRVLYGHGYCHGVFSAETGAWNDRDVLEIARSEAVHYELAAFSRVVPLELDPAELACCAELARDPYLPLHVVDGQPVVQIDVDVHHGLMVDLDVAPLRARAVPSALGAGLTLCPADHLWFSVLRFYMEVARGKKRSLRHFAYLGSVARDPEVDWQVVRAEAARHAAAPALYYWLSFLEFLGYAPGIDLDVFAPTRGDRRADWGWQLGALFDVVEPAPFASGWS